MTLYNKNEIEFNFNYSMLDQQSGEICLSYYRELQQFCWYDKPSMNTEMKRWRKLAKNNEIKICKYNNLEFEYNGKKYYTFVVQPYKNGDIEECGIDPIMLFIFGNLVSGCAYVFKTKENRDNIYNYVMKDIQDPSNL